MNYFFISLFFLVSCAVHEFQPDKKIMDQNMEKQLRDQVTMPLVTFIECLNHRGKDTDKKNNFNGDISYTVKVNPDNIEVSSFKSTVPHSKGRYCAGKITQANMDKIHSAYIKKFQDEAGMHTRFIYGKNYQGSKVHLKIVKGEGDLTGVEPHLDQIEQYDVKVKDPHKVGVYKHDLAASMQVSGLLGSIMGTIMANN